MEIDKSMDSNIPVVGGQPDDQENTNPQSEVAGTASDVQQSGSPSPEPINAVSSMDYSVDAGSSDDSGAYDAADSVSENDEQTQTSDDAATRRVRKGELVEGTISRLSPTEILVDLGLKSEGIVPSRELDRVDHDTIGSLKVGDPVLAYVLDPSDQNDNVVLSLARALEETDWRRAESLRESGEVFNGKVDGYNKGGLIVRFGRLRGFVPESQVSRDRRRRAEGTEPQDKWAKMRGEDISVKVLEVDRGRNRLIFSEREAIPMVRENQKERLLTELAVGDRRRGRVKSLADFGAFVDVGGADGLVHLTELSWKHVTHPKEVLRVGQEVDVEVISIDPVNKRIGLSIRRTEQDPWMAVASQYAIGQLVQGTITKLTKFGAFARLVEAPEIEGLIHISELSDRRVNHPRDVVNEGEVRTLRVVKIDAENRRIGLSIKRVDDADYMENDRRSTPRPARTEAPMDSFADFEVATLKEDERRRNERRKGGGKKGGKRGGGFGEYEDYDSDY
jgi:small subunit ribosomal protein S1